MGSSASTSLGHGGNRAEQLCQEIARAIRSGRLRQGQRLAPIRQLAGQYDVSFGTARRACQQLEQMGLLELRHGAGVYVRGGAGRRRSGQTRTGHVCLLMPYSRHLFDHLSTGIIQCLQPHGLRCVPSQSMHQFDGGKDLLPVLETWRADPPLAVVLGIAKHHMRRILEPYLAPQTRVIRYVLQPDDEEPQWHSVGPDVPRMAELAVAHLLGKGHRRIGLVQPARRIIPELEYQTRKVKHAKWIMGLGTALRNRGLRHALTIVHTDRGVDDPREEGNSDPFAEHNMTRLRRWLRQPDRPTAVIGASDYHAVAVRAAAMQIGLRVPDDLELLGVGDTPWSMTYNLSSLAVNEQQCARQIAELVLTDAQELSQSIRRIAVAPILVERSGRSDGALMPSITP